VTLKLVPSLDETLYDPIQLGSQCVLNDFRSPFSASYAADIGRIDIKLTGDSTVEAPDERC
jgi:hypothetical protein